jgi:hypothetical protein
MTAKGFSNSDLARRVWGETTDNKGYKVARNRDRIAVYLQGKGFPEPATLHKITQKLGVAKEELAPHVAIAPVDRVRPEFSMTTMGDDSSRAFVQVNALLPLSIAVEISKLVLEAKAPQTQGPAEDEGDREVGYCASKGSDRHGGV